MIIITLGIILILSVISFQDIKYKQIYWLAFPFFGILLAINNIVTNGFIPFLISTGLNILFISLQFSLLALYLSVRNMKKKNHIFKMIGAGDMLFLFCLCFGYLFNKFIFILIAGLSFSLLTWWFYSLLGKKDRQEIPLCGIMALFLCFIVLLDKVAPSLLNNTMLYIPPI